MLAQDQKLRLHAAIEGADLPALCKDRDSVALMMRVLSRAGDVHAAQDREKAQRLSSIAARLESELCSHPGRDEIVILRCKLEQRDLPEGPVSVVKMSGILRTEPSKGEQAFYGLIRAKIDASPPVGSDALEANRRWCAAEAGADEPIKLSPDIVQRVQQRFYDFGFNIREINGQLSQETVQALLEFQKWAELPPTGQLTQLTLQKIDAMSPPSAWVAIAFDGRGNWGAVGAAPTRRGAEIGAVNRLRSRSRSDFKVAALPSPWCISLATTRYQQRSRRGRITYTQAFTNAGSSLAGAQQSVLEYCDRQKGGGTCQVREALCADANGGEEKRFDPSNLPVNAPARFDAKNLPLNSLGAQSGSGGEPPAR